MAGTQLPVDLVLFINLDFRTDRLEHMNTILSSCRWPVERIPAVRFLSEEEAGGDVGKSLNLLSIWRSHRNALVRANEILVDGALILLQDDVSIEPKVFGEFLELPEGLPDDWEVLMYSPRYRKIPTAGSEETSERKWERNLFTESFVYLPTVKKKYVANGAHFCVFRNRAVVESVIAKIDATEFRKNFDDFLGRRFSTYGIHTKLVRTAGLGSDH